MNKQGKTIKNYYLLYLHRNVPIQFDQKFFNIQIQTDLTQKSPRKEKK